MVAKMVFGDSDRDFGDSDPDFGDSAKFFLPCRKKFVPLHRLSRWRLGLDTPAKGLEDGLGRTSGQPIAFICAGRSSLFIKVESNEY